MSENERKKDKWAVLAPLRLEEVRPCDLVICRECEAVRHVGDLQLENRDSGFFEYTEGVFCPGCDQRLFDRQGWIAHQAEQLVWDREKAAREEDERKGRQGPLAGRTATAAEDEEEKDDHEMTRDEQNHKEPEPKPARRGRPKEALV